MKKLALERAIDRLNARRKACWAQAGVFLDNRDSHGLHDISIEIQALGCAIEELKRDHKQDWHL